MATAKINESWQTNKSLVERNRIMLERQLYTDVKFVFQKKQNTESKPCVLHAHKYMLISSSPVFCSMLTGELAEDGDILIEDVEYETFAAMLRFIYCEELDLTGEIVMQILYASKKYILPAMTSKCTAFLEQNLNTENACTILEQSLLFDEEELLETCLSLVKQHTGDVFQSEGFKTLSNSALDRILQQGELSVAEVEVFKACLQWARSKCADGGTCGERIREKMGDVIYKIRFPVMSAQDFSSVVSPTGVLSHMEELACLRYICNPHNRVDLSFPTKKRRIVRSALFCGLQRPYVTGSQKIHSNVLTSTMKLNRPKHWLSPSADVKCLGNCLLKGFRILCKERDIVTIFVSSASHGKKGAGRGGRTGGRLPSQEKERLCEILESEIQTVQKDRGSTFADLYFPESCHVQLEKQQDYLVDIVIWYRDREKVLDTDGVVQQCIFAHSASYSVKDCIIYCKDINNPTKTHMLGILVTLN